MKASEEYAPEDILSLLSQPGWGYLKSIFREIEALAISEIAAKNNVEYHAGCIAAVQRVKMEMRAKAKGQLEFDDREAAVELEEEFKL